MVRRRLTRRVWRVGSIRRCLAKWLIVWSQSAVHFIGGDMVKTTAPHIPRLVVEPEDTRSLKQREGAYHIRLDERRGTHDGPIHVGLRGEMHDSIDRMLTQQMLDQGAVADISWHDGMAVWIGQLLQVIQRASVREHIQVDN